MTDLRPPEPCSERAEVGRDGMGDSDWVRNEAPVGGRGSATGSAAHRRARRGARERPGTAGRSCGCRPATPPRLGGRSGAATGDGMSFGTHGRCRRAGALVGVVPLLTIAALGVACAGGGEGSSAPPGATEIGPAGEAATVAVTGAGVVAAAPLLGADHPPAPAILVGPALVALSGDRGVTWRTSEAGEPTHGLHVPPWLAAGAGAGTGRIWFASSQPDLTSTWPARSGPTARRGRGSSAWACRRAPSPAPPWSTTWPADPGRPGTLARRGRWGRWGRRLREARPGPACRRCARAGGPGGPIGCPPGHARAPPERPGSEV